MLPTYKKNNNISAAKKNLLKKYLFIWCEESYLRFYSAEVNIRYTV